MPRFDTFKEKIDESRMAGKSLHRTMEQLIFPKAEVKLPLHSSTHELSKRFSDYFSKKILAIRAGMKDNPSLTHDTSPHGVTPSLRVLRQISATEIEYLISLSPAKSCVLDPFPTKLLRAYKETLVPSLAKLINTTLSSGFVPEELKLALITPALKKPSLDPEKLENYRPISNLSFVSKLLERVVLKQLMEFLHEHNLLVPTQST